jgi:hypothetical protein
MRCGEKRFSATPALEEAARLRAENIQRSLEAGYCLLEPGMLVEFGAESLQNRVRLRHVMSSVHLTISAWLVVEFQFNLPHLLATFYRGSTWRGVGGEPMKKLVKVDQKVTWSIAFEHRYPVV